jgi:hypothetical protein
VEQASAMAIEEVHTHVVQYRTGALNWPIIQAEPGIVSVNSHHIRAAKEAEEFIDTLRKAVKVSNLPDGERYDNG